MRRALLPLILLLNSCSGDRPPVSFHEEPPARLSDWGVVWSERDRLVLNEGVLPYALNTPLFTDYAQKLRTVWMPSGKAARYSADGDWEFPVGTVLTKTFYYPLAGARRERVTTSSAESLFDGSRLTLAGLRLLETRLLVRQAGGWEAYPYVWNEAQTEARLKRTGDMVRLTLVSEGAVERQFTYVVPDANQCAGCHRPDHGSKALRPLGPKTRHLNRSGRDERNQLETWTQAGYLDGAPRTELAPRLAVWDEAGQHDIETRARAYLDINCGHCHNPAGAADTSGLFLDIHTTEARRLGRCKPPIAAGRGSGDRRYSIVPGSPDASILVYRMETSDPGEAMPELGRGLVHAEGVALIRQWISAMDGDCQAGSAT